MNQKEYEKQVQRIQKYQELNTKLDLLKKLSNLDNDIKEAYIVLNDKGGLVYLPKEFHEILTEFLKKQANDYIPFVEDELKQI